MKRVIKLALAPFGLKIQRVAGGVQLTRRPPTVIVRSPANRTISRPPEANFDNIALVMEHFTTARPGSVFVQIGANDGETSDSVNSFVKQGVLKSVLVEPIPSVFQKLSAFYQNAANVSLVNAAIAKQNGRAIIYAVKDAGRWAGSAWASQLASFDRSHLIRHGIAADEIVETTVECLDFPTLMKQHEIERIDVLQIDTEGFDAEVVLMALALPEPPLCICFEYVQFVKTMDQPAVNAFYAKLEEKGYAWSHDRINTMAVHRSFVVSGKPAPVK